jgi:tetratricopeptide (TPR) repeat protein
LELKKLVFTDTATILYLNITNRIASGSFCADKQIFLRLPSGKKVWLRESSGIPVCPEAYHFSYIGEELPFQLIFPPTGSDVFWMDLVEQCNDNCFSILGIVSNENLNNQVEKGYDNISKKNYAEALKIFKPLAGKFGNSALTGSIYYNLIYIYNKQDDPDNLTFWYGKLANSDIQDKSVFLQQLKQEGIPK